MLCNPGLKRFHPRCGLPVAAVGYYGRLFCSCASPGRRVYLLNSTLTAWKEERELWPFLGNGWSFMSFPPPARASVSMCPALPCPHPSRRPRPFIPFCKSLYPFVTVLARCVDDQIQSSRHHHSIDTISSRRIFKSASFPRPRP